MRSYPAEMKLRALQLQLVKPMNVSARNIRSWILDNLNAYGEPLRWAITEIAIKENNFSKIIFTLEAVVIIADFADLED